jgi:hypothetical protein
MAYSAKELEQETLLVGRLVLFFTLVWFAEVVTALIAIG